MGAWELYNNDHFGWRNPRALARCGCNRGDDLLALRHGLPLDSGGPCTLVRQRWLAEMGYDGTYRGGWGGN